MSLKGILKGTKGTKVEELRQALEGSGHKGVAFVLKVAVNGPYVLLGLYRDSHRLIDDEIPATDRTLVVDLTGKIKKSDLPFYLRWSVGAGHTIPGLSAYLVVNESVRKVGSKGKLKKGEVWRGERRIASSMNLDWD